MVIFFDFMKPPRLFTMPSTIFCLRAWAVAKLTTGALRLDAELGGVGDVALHGGRLEERLGRDAATVEAGAAERVLLDDGDVETGRGGVQRRPVAAGAAADHHEIELLFHRIVLHFCRAAWVICAGNGTASGAQVAAGGG